MRDWLAGYAPPAETYVDSLRAAVEGRDTVEALQRRLQAEPKNPEVRIKLGRKFQVLTVRDRAQTLFREAAALDPKGSLMTRTEDGSPVSCRDLAEFLLARMLGPAGLRAYLRSHPITPLRREAYVGATRYIDLINVDDRAFAGEILNQVPRDPELLAQLDQWLDRLGMEHASDPIVESGIEYARRTKAWLEGASPSIAAAALADLYILKGYWDQAESAYGPGFIAGQTLAWARNLIDYAAFWRTRKRNEADAMAAIRLALTLQPEDTGLRRSAARAYLIDLPRMSEALGVYGPAWLESGIRPLEDRFNYFSFWMEKKANLESALATLDSILVDSPDSLYYRRAAAEVLWRAGLTEKTEAVFGPGYAAAHPERLDYLFEYGLFWTGRGSHSEDAAAALSKAASDPRYGWPKREEAARMLIRANRKPEAAAVFGPSYLERLAGNERGLSAYLRFWMEADREPDSPAIMRALEALERVPDLSQELRIQLASIHLQGGRADKAEAIYGSAYAASIASDPLKLISYAGFWAFRRRNLFSATDAAQAAVRLSPSNASAWSALADLLQIDGKTEEARKAIEKAIALAGSKSDRERYENRRVDIAGAGIKKVP